MAEQQPTWRLISVLFSNIQLTESLALTLTETAFDLYRDRKPFCDIGGDTLSGRVKNLQQDAMLGVIGGPTFEARLETNEGQGTVRYILTREAIESREEKQQVEKKLRREYLN